MIEVIQNTYGQLLDQLNSLREQADAHMAEAAQLERQLGFDMAHLTDFLGGRAEIAQRALRTQHGAGRGEFHTIMTKREFEGNQRRLAALFALGADVRYKQ